MKPSSPIGWYDVHIYTNNDVLVGNMSIITRGLFIFLFCISSHIAHEMDFFKAIGKVAEIAKVVVDKFENHENINDAYDDYLPSEQVYILALLSLNIYVLEEGFEDQEELEEALNKDLEDYSVIVESIRPAENGSCGMAVFRHRWNHNTILAIKGTSIDNVSDLENVLGIAVGGDRGRRSAELHLQIARNLIETYGVTMITGHSLGGYMAEIIATTEALQGIAFCAPGTMSPLCRLGGSTVRGFHNINYEDDVLGNYLRGVLYHVQTPIYVMGNHHRIRNMVQYFRHRREYTNLNVQALCEFRLNAYYFPEET
jgi:hypothetical protein